MRVVLFLVTALMCSVVGHVQASQSIITDVDGSACMGDDKSRKQTEQAAVTDAKRKAVEYAVTYIKSETQVKNFELEKDLISAYSSASVRIIQELEKGWFKDLSLGDCYKIKIKSEVIPDSKSFEVTRDNKALLENPLSPLNIKIWTDKREYKRAEKMKIYIKGNKPFYARVVNKDPGGSTIQLLPNPYRTEYYFNGSTIYEIPASIDRFEMEVVPPFGDDSIVVYGSTAPLGDISLKPFGGVYEVMTKPQDIADMTRGVKIVKKKEDSGIGASEFFEDTIQVKTWE